MCKVFEGILEQCLKNWDMHPTNLRFAHKDFTILAENEQISLATYLGNAKNKELKQKILGYFQQKMGAKPTLVQVQEPDNRLSLYLPSAWEGEVLSLQNTSIDELKDGFWKLYQGEAELFLRDFERKYGRGPLERKFVSAFRGWHKAMADALVGLVQDDAQTKFSMS